MGRRGWDSGRGSALVVGIRAVGIGLAAGVWGAAHACLALLRGIGSAVVWVVVAGVPAVGRGTVAAMAAILDGPACRNALAHARCCWPRACDRTGTRPAGCGNARCRAGLGARSAGPRSLGAPVGGGGSAGYRPRLHPCHPSVRPVVCRTGSDCAIASLGRAPVRLIPTNHTCARERSCYGAASSSWPRAQPPG